MASVWQGIIGFGEELVFVAMAERRMFCSVTGSGRHIGGVADCPAAQYEGLVGEFKGELAGCLAGFLYQRGSSAMIPSRTMCRVIKSDERSSTSSRRISDSGVSLIG